MPPPHWRAVWCGSKLLHLFVPPFTSKMRMMIVLPHRVVHVHYVNIGKDLEQCHTNVWQLFFVEVSLLRVSVIGNRGPANADFRGWDLRWIWWRHELPRMAAEPLTSLRDFVCLCLPNAKSANEDKANRILLARISLSVTTGECVICRVIVIRGPRMWRQCPRASVPSPPHVGEVSRGPGSGGLGHTAEWTHGLECGWLASRVFLWSGHQAASSQYWVS